MTVNECIMGRRSIRKFKDTPVSKDVLEAIIKEASYSPSWKNTQIVRYIALTGKSKDDLASCTKIWGGNGDIMRNAPMVIAVTFVTGRCGYERDGSFSTEKGDRWQMFDAGIATETLVLSAYDKGLGTVIMGLYDNEDARKVLGLPEGQEISALVAIGYPDINPDAPKRKEVSDILTYME